MSFEPPAPGLTTIVIVWDEWEPGETTPGPIVADIEIADIDRADIDRVPAELAASGWTPSS